MKLDCASIQSNQFVHGTSVPEYLLLILNDFSYHVYYYGIETVVKCLSRNRITYLQMMVTYAGRNPIFK